MDSEHCRPVRTKRIIFVTLVTSHNVPALVKINLFMLLINFNYQGVLACSLINYCSSRVLVKVKILTKSKALHKHCSGKSIKD